MEYYNEKVEYENPLLSLRVLKPLRNSEEANHWHYHREIEMLLVLEGMLEVYIDEEFHRLDPGDTILIGASQLHRDRCIQSPLDYIVLQFDLEQFFDHSSMTYMRFFFETENPLSRANYIFQDNQVLKSEFAHIIKQIYEETQSKEIGYELAVNMLIKQIILLLLRNDSLNMLAEPENFDRTRLKPVFNYVEARLNGRIQVEEVCKLANMSYYYFVKFFKKTVGLSFTEYVNYRKIKAAQRILLTKDLSISEIGERIGMPNMAHFYKMFKKFNDCSPKEFQRRMQSWQTQAAQQHTLNL